MDDETAYMELVKANNQGELLALEIGIHALESVERADGKAGGGLQAYASEISKSKTMLTEWTKAAGVYKSVRSSESIVDKVKHLYEISKADSTHWQMLVDLLIKCDWSVKDVQAAVKRVKRSTRIAFNQYRHNHPVI
jgi:hypothetical protein